MITLADLAALHAEHGGPGAAAAGVTPITVGDVVIGGEQPVLMAALNLSSDSTYRESVAFSTESAVRKARVQVAEGARVIDLGAEASAPAKSEVGPDQQIAGLVPVIEAIQDEVLISVETYEPVVVEACLKAGARVLNMTGREHETAMLELAAAHDAAVVLCFGDEANVRRPTTVDPGSDPFPRLVDHFGERLDRARALGVSRLLVDPGVGFRFDGLGDPLVRTRHQARVLSQSFRLQALGVPVCNALPHAFEIFEEHFRTAEGFFAVLARLGGTDLLRIHEVGRVRSVLTAMAALQV